MDVVNKSLLGHIKDEKIKEKIERLLNNQYDFMNKNSLNWDLPEWKNSNTFEIKGDVSLLVKSKHFKTFIKNGKPYLTACVVCLAERDEKNHIFADYRFGYSTVHPNDKYDAELGKEIAYKRAVGIDKSKPGLFTSGVGRQLDNFEHKYRWEMEIYTPELMLRLVRQAMPTINRNKFVFEKGVETEKDEIYYISKETEFLC